MQQTAAHALFYRLTPTLAHLCLQLYQFHLGPWLGDLCKRHFRRIVTSSLLSCPTNRFGVQAFATLLVASPRFGPGPKSRRSGFVLGRDANTAARELLNRNPVIWLSLGHLCASAESDNPAETSPNSLRRELSAAPGSGSTRRRGSESDAELQESNACPKELARAMDAASDLLPRAAVICQGLGSVRLVPGAVPYYELLPSSGCYWRSPAGFRPAPFFYSFRPRWIATPAGGETNCKYVIQTGVC